MKKLLTLIAVAEAGTGVALIVLPSLVGRLLLGAELTGVAIPVARVTGIALVALGVVWFPGRTALCGMLTYSVLTTPYLLYLAIRGEWVGPLIVAGCGNPRRPDAAAHLAAVETRGHQETRTSAAGQQGQRIRVVSVCRANLTKTNSMT